MFYQAAKLGFTSLLLPQELGSQGKKCIDFAIVQEELGAVDVSIACNYFTLPTVMPLVIARAGSSEQRDRLLSDANFRKPLLFSAAESEPNVASSDLFCPTPDSQTGMKTVAARDGDTYILNGKKSLLVTKYYSCR